MSEPTEFCSWQLYSDYTRCRRCGSVNYEKGGEPTCPPWITRSEPDGKRLPHIKTQEQNKAAYQAWIDAENYKLRQANPALGETA